MTRLSPGVVFALLLSVAPVASAQDVWTAVPSGTAQNLRAVHFVSADVGFVAGDGGTVLRTTNGGLNWTDASPSSGPDFHGVHFFDATTGVVVGDNGTILRTTNAGDDWTPVASGVEAPLQAVSFAGSVGIVGGGSQTILRSVDAGVSWDTVQTDFFGGGFPGAHMLDATHGYVAGTNSIFQPLAGWSDDGGLTFDFASFYLNSNEGNLRDVHFLSASTGVAVANVWDGRGAISRTTNGGQDWTTIIFDNPLDGLGFATETRGYAVGQLGGMLVTDNGGMTWESTLPIVSEELYDVHFPSPAAGFAVGAGGTILKGVLTTAADPTPDGAALVLEASPNPSAGGASVRFTLAEAVDVSLRVYDALGRQVAVLVEGVRGAGVHEMRLEARLPPGTYLAVLQAGRERATLPVVIR
jgi:photosystem II stability/assembly factor-like uncharacterized protein